jgi:acyl-CoA thioesterase
LFGDGQVFDHQRVHGESPGKKYRDVAIGFEQFVCSGVTNAWAVPELVSDPNKYPERPQIKGFGDDWRAGGKCTRRYGEQRMTDCSQQTA